VNGNGTDPPKSIVEQEVISPTHPAPIRISLVFMSQAFYRSGCYKSRIFSDNHKIDTAVTRLMTVILGSSIITCVDIYIIDY
jgi:hypothetical protein